MKAIEELKNEHDGIGIMLQVCKIISDKFQREEPINKDHINGILEFLTVFVDKCHHGKEEEFLFPALEKAGILREGGPVGVLLKEHEQGRKLISSLEFAIGDYVAGNKTAISIMGNTLYEYTSLMTQHIEKENRVLFTMAESILSAAHDHELIEAFEQLEINRIGNGRHEQFHILLNELKNMYLN